MQDPNVTTDEQLKEIRDRLCCNGTFHACCENACIIAADLVEARSALHYVLAEWRVHPPCSDFLVKKVKAALHIS